MATDTLSPSSSPTAERTPDAPPKADGKPPAIPNPTTIDVLFVPADPQPQLNPPPRTGSRPRENGYQFASEETDTQLTFEIDPRNRDTHQFTGCRFTPVRNAFGGDFPMPGYTWALRSPFTLVVEFKFTPGRIEQVNVLPQYHVDGAPGSFDPQVGNDGGNIEPPPPLSDYGTQGA